LELNYKIFIKDSDKNLKLKAIRCELQNANDNVLYFEIDLSKIQKQNVIQVRQPPSEILEFKYQQANKIGINQFYNFECFLTKKVEDLEIDNINLRFILEQENNVTKSVQFASNLKNLKNLNSLEHKQSKSLSTMDDSNLIGIAHRSLTLDDKTQSNDIPVPIKDQHHLQLVDHEFIIKSPRSANDQSDHLTIYHNVISMKLNKIEYNKPIKCNFLVKFIDKGNYTIKIEADYKILKKEIYDDFSVLKYSGGVLFEVMAPFQIKYE
jgi:hypothetical protein